MTRTRIALALAAVLLASPGAGAMDDGRYADSPLKDWFGSLWSKGWGSCCSGADGTAVSDVDWRSRGGHYQVRLGGEWVDVPDAAVVTVPNLYGRAMVWPMNGTINPETKTLESTKGKTIRCFLPGPGA